MMAAFLGRPPPAPVVEPAVDATRDVGEVNEDDMSEREREAAADKAVARNFQDSWKQLNPHLRYSETTKKMYCLCCGQTEHTGSSTLKKSVVVDHVNNKGSGSRQAHSANVPLYEARIARDVNTQPTMPAAVSKMQSNAHAKHAVTLRAMGYILDRGSPFAQCVPLKSAMCSVCEAVESSS